MPKNSQRPRVWLLRCAILFAGPVVSTNVLAGTLERWQSFAPGVEVRLPLAQEGRLDDIAGAAVILHGARASVLIDPGGLPAEGKDAARQLKSAKPVFLVYTQARARAVLAAHWASRATQVYASGATAQFMRQQCETCISNLRVQSKKLPRELPSVVPVVYPDVAGQERRLLDIGRPILLLSNDKARPSGVTVALDQRARAAVVGTFGPLLHVPDLREADLDAWLDFLDLIEREQVATVIAVDGIAPATSAFVPLRQYLSALRTFAEDAARRGTDVVSALPQAPAHPYPANTANGTAHMLNVQAQLRKAEDAWLNSR